MMEYTGPIPGESLTRKKGSAKWEQPPMISDVDEAMEYYVDKFSDNEVKETLFGMLEMGIPISMIVTMATRGETMKGTHTVDLGIALRPLVHEHIKTMAELAEVDFVEDFSEIRDDKAGEKSEKGWLSMLQGKMASGMPDEKGQLPEEVTVPDEEQEEMPPQAEEEGGLMSPPGGV